MKNWKLILYISIQILLILFARLIFINTGKIVQAFTASDQLKQVEPAIQNLYILQAFILFVPFLIVLYLIFIELASINRQRKEAARNKREASEVVHKDEQEDREELLRQQEQLIVEQVEYNRKKLNTCLSQYLNNKKLTSSKAVSEAVLSCISKVYEITQAEIFLRHKNEETDKLILSATFAFYIPEEKVHEFEMGEGLIGQVAKAGEFLIIDELPEGYIIVKSGLGSATPSHLVIIPWKNKEGEVFGIIEIATFKPMGKRDIKLIEELESKLVDFYH